jgi:hypothetical protein
MANEHPWVLLPNRPMNDPVRTTWRVVDVCAEKKPEWIFFIFEGGE